MVIAYLLGGLLGGVALWRLFGWFVLLRMAYRVWRHLRDAPPSGEGGANGSEGDGSAGSEGSGERYGDGVPVPDGVLSRSEALKVLGLEGNPERDEIMANYRKLMQKNHPDRGGSDYLATLINEAKNKLL